MARRRRQKYQWNFTGKQKPKREKLGNPGGVRVGETLAGGIKIDDLLKSNDE